MQWSLQLLDSGDDLQCKMYTFIIIVVHYICISSHKHTNTHTVIVVSIHDVGIYVETYM